MHHVIFGDPKSLQIFQQQGHMLIQYLANANNKVLRVMGHHRVIQSDDCHLKANQKGRDRGGCRILRACWFAKIGSTRISVAPKRSFARTRRHLSSLTWLICRCMRKSIKLKTRLAWLARTSALNRKPQTTKSQRWRAPGSLGTDSCIPRLLGFLTPNYSNDLFFVEPKAYLLLGMDKRKLLRCVTTCCAATGRKACGTLAETYTICATQSSFGLQVDW